jgi:hypothetical protein
MNDADATLTEKLEQNRENLKALLEALDADPSTLDDPEEKARRKAFFTGVTDENAKMSDGERIEWLFESTSEAIREAAKAAGAPERKLATDATDPVKNSEFTLKPKDADRRAAQRKKNREEKKADVDTSGFLDPRGE